MITLPDLNQSLKPYIHEFMATNARRNSPYQVEVLKLNKLKILFSGPCGEFYILMFFDSKDKVRTAIVTEDAKFYTSLFYIEVLRKRRDNEAWMEIMSKYPRKWWIERYIYFLLKAPNTIDKYWDMLTCDKEP